ncbi:hypothetical protein L596_020956 [Steinernema carpocapsae]|uniref:Uncharacterized protein n=1 Tax=Steinernema carpocapsae TaxID=34508 RepID=A0A4U5MV36_STECR|nr:hypothetical protein L596_020956 [Steinernema carpocapsae]
MIIEYVKTRFQEYPTDHPTELPTFNVFVCDTSANHMRRWGRRKREFAKVVSRARRELSRALMALSFYPYRAQRESDDAAFDGHHHPEQVPGQNLAGFWDNVT